MKKLLFLILIGFLIGVSETDAQNYKKRMFDLNKEESWFEELPATADTITYPAYTFVKFSIIPLPSNTDTVRIGASTKTVITGHTGGYYEMIGSSGAGWSKIGTIAPLGEIRIITKTGAGCYVEGVLLIP